MGAAVVAFFNNKGGVGKSTLVYHLAHMYAELGKVVLAADLDPQANLTASFLNDGALEQLWTNPHQRATVSGMLAPLVEGTGDIAPGPGQAVGRNLVLLPGDLELSNLEDELSNAWPRCLEGPSNPRAFRVMSAFGRLLRKVAERHAADIVLVDVGPNLGAINRAALVASDFVVVPLGPDLFSVQGLRNLGPALRVWREGWRDRLARSPASVPGLPAGTMIPLGYVMLTQTGRGEQPTRSHQRWLSRVPGVYAEEVLGLGGAAAAGAGAGSDISVDRHISVDRRCLAQIQHYRGLMPMAQEARRPIFQLRHIDGAIGNHQQTVRTAWNDFSTLAMRMARGMSAPDADAAVILGETYRAPAQPGGPVAIRALASAGRPSLGPGESRLDPLANRPKRPGEWAEPPVAEGGPLATRPKRPGEWAEPPVAEGGPLAGAGAGPTPPGAGAMPPGPAVSGPTVLGPRTPGSPMPGPPRPAWPGSAQGPAGRGFGAPRVLAPGDGEPGRDQNSRDPAARDPATRDQAARERAERREAGRSRVIEYPVRPNRNPWQGRPANEGWPASAAARF